ncbi:MAG: hypothetical protein ACOYD0_12095 [Candidatus Nanopelagicales bacterium]
MADELEPDGPVRRAAGRASRRFPKKLVALFATIFAVAVVGAGLGSINGGSASTLGGLTVSNTLQVQRNAAAVTPVAQVRSVFTGNNDLNGLTATFDPGTGVFGTPAPNWNAVRLGGNAPQANTWQTRSAGGGYVRRLENATSGTGYSMALIPWLTRKSTASLTFTQVDNAGTNDTVAGLVLNSNAGGSSGIAAVVDCNNKICQGTLWQITGNNSSSVCATAVNLSAALSTNQVTITNFTNVPGQAGNDVTATFTQTGGSGAKTLTCDPTSVQNGAYSGMFSAYGSNNSRFLTPLFSYS